MSEPGHEENEDVERGYAEENSDAPLDDVERAVSAPPEERWPEHLAERVRIEGVNPVRRRAGQPDRVPGGEPAQSG